MHIPKKTLRFEMLSK
jgi:hypothetical protein